VNPGQRVGVVLSGGGARAAYEVGVLKSIYRGSNPVVKGQNVPEVFCGTGAGAFNAAVVASRIPEQQPSPVAYLESLWADEIPREGLSRNNRVFRRRLDTRQFFDIPYMWRRPFKSWAQYFSDFGRLAPELLSRTGKAIGRRNFSSWLDISIWNDTGPMHRLISESVSLQLIREGEAAHNGTGRPKRILRVVATERGTGQPMVFGNSDFDEETGHALILASCALPIIFPSVNIRGREYMYGGLVMQTPLQPAVDAGCTVIHLVHNEPRAEAPLEREESSTRDVLNRTIAVALAATVERDLESRRRINQVLDALDKAERETGANKQPFEAALAGYRRVQVHRYRPRTQAAGNKSLLAFNRSEIQALIAAGEQDTDRHDCQESGCIL
jgi:NTE family protein